MKNMKKVSAALLAVMMLISMLSCMVFNVSAAQLELSGPVSIEKLPVIGSSTGSGIVVGGTPLTQDDILVVNSDWKGLSGGIQAIKLNDIVYTVTIGVNAFGSVADAVAAASGYESIYITAGIYEGNIAPTVSGLKLYGPFAGVCPNDAADLSKANALRPAAEMASTDGEAVLRGGVGLAQAGADLTLDGLYLDGDFSFATAGSAYRYGTYVRNCIINTTNELLFNFSGGNNPNVEIKNNRIRAINLVDIIGMMDLEISNNYLDVSGLSIEMKTVTAGSMGSYALIEGNYYKNCGGIFNFASARETALYTVIVRDNIIEDMGAAAIVSNTFYADHTLPGVNIQVTGNKFMGIDAGVTPFMFPYVKTTGQAHINRFNHIININENYVDIPAGTMFVESDMNGVLNLGYNYYSTPISVDRITKYETTQLILYPYYEDEAMTILKGDARFIGGMDGVEIDHEEKLVTINLVGTELENVSPIDLSAALIVEDGCSWKLYEEATLQSEIKDKKLYPEGMSTQMYAAIIAADGKTSNIYKVRVLTGHGTKAELIDIVFKSSLVSDAVVEGKTFTYTFPAHLAYAEYDIKVSTGAKYQVFEKYDQNEGFHKEMADMGGYIPYGGYEFDILITSADDLVTNLYHVVFNRDRSATYDPSLMGGKTPAEGKYSLMRDGSLQFVSDILLTEAAFELVATPGATYTVYADLAKTEKLYTSADIKPIKLDGGNNIFYVEVTDGTYTNMVKFVVRNETRSSDATITGLTGLSPKINDNVIEVQSGGNSISIIFNTKSPYAVVNVYGDAAKKYEVSYTSTPVEGEPNRIIDERSFSLDITHAVSKYFVECVAEDGTINDYTLVVTKIVRANSYVDVPSGEWYAKYVEAASAEGILLGSPYGENYIFRPQDNTSRQEMAVVASRLMGINSAAFAEVKLPFADNAKIADWALGSVKVVYALGVMKGSLDAKGLFFNPAKNVTREEAVVMFDRIYDLKGSADLTVYSDYNSVSGWAKDAMSAAVASGIVEGAYGKLNPRDPITRAELAALIARV